MSSFNNFYIDLTKFCLYKKEIYHIIVITFKLCIKWIKDDLKREDENYTNNLKKVLKKETNLMIKLNDYFKNF